MKVAIFGLGIIGTIGLFVAGLIFSSHRIAFIWAGFTAVVALLLSFALYWHNEIISSPKLQKPTFSEQIEKVSFSLGERGISVGYKRDSLKNSLKEPFNFADFKPVKIYIKNDNLFADVKIFGGSRMPPIEIRQNELINKPTEWDFNSNDKALEIVNEKKVPIYQFFYKTPSHIVVNGIFPFPGGLILANENGATLNPILPTTFKLERIFKYPSWKYPGQYEK